MTSSSGRQSITTLAQPVRAACSAAMAGRSAGFGTGHRIRGPSITVGVKIDRLTFGKSETADSQYRHNTTYSFGQPPNARFATCSSSGRELPLAAWTAIPLATVLR